MTGVPRIYSTFTDDGCNKIILSHVVGDRYENIVFLHLSPPSYWQYIDNIVFLHLSPPFTGDRGTAWAFDPFAFWAKMTNGGLATLIRGSRQCLGFCPPFAFWTKTANGGLATLIRGSRQRQGFL